MGESTIRDLLIAIGFDIKNLTGLKAIDNTMAGVVNNAKRMVQVITGVSVALSGLVYGAMHHAVEVSRTSQKLGIATDELQRLEGTANLAGVSIESLTSAMWFFEKSTGKMMSGETNELSKLFQKLHINIKDSAGQMRSQIDIIEEVADKFNLLGSQSEKAFLATSLFGRGASKEMVLLLNKGSAGIQELREQFEMYGHIMDKEAIAKSMLLTKQLKLVKFSMQGLKDIVGTAIMPAFIKGTGAILQFVKANRKIIEEKTVKFFEKLTEVMGFFFRVAIAGFKAIDSIVNKMGGWTFVLKSLSIALMAVVGYKTISGIFSLVFALKNLILAFRALSFATMPFTMILTLIVGITSAISLMIQDFDYFKKGLPSFIGKLKEAHPVLFKIAQIFEIISGTLVHGIVWGINEAVSSMGSLYDFVVKIEDIFKSIGSGIAKMFGGLSISQQNFKPLENAGNKANITINHAPVINVTSNSGDGNKAGENIRDVIDSQFKKFTQNLTTGIFNAFPVGR